MKDPTYYTNSEDIGRGEYIPLRVVLRPHARDGSFTVFYGKNWENEARCFRVALRNYVIRGGQAIDMQRPNGHDSRFANLGDLFLGKGTV